MISEPRQLTPVLRLRLPSHFSMFLTPRYPRVPLGFGTASLPETAPAYGAAPLSCVHQPSERPRVKGFECLPAGGLDAGGWGQLSVSAVGPFALLEVSYVLMFCEAFRKITDPDTPIHRISLRLGSMAPEAGNGGQLHRLRDMGSPSPYTRHTPALQYPLFDWLLPLYRRSLLAMHDNHC